MSILPVAICAQEESALSSRCYAAVLAVARPGACDFSAGNIWDVSARC